MTYLKKCRIILPLLLVVSMVFLECSQPFSQGQSLYEAQCSRCHGMDGKGFENLYPGILNSTYLLQPESGMACVITHGSTYLENHGNHTTGLEMPGNKQLSPVEVLNIINYLSWQFGSREQVTLDMVADQLEGCEH